MSQFIYIFCTSPHLVSLREITQFINNGGYFEHPSVSADEDPSGVWSKLLIEYETGKRPIVIRRDAHRAVLGGAIEEATATLATVRSDAKSSIMAHLQHSGQLYTVEIDDTNATEDCWAMIDSIEAFLAVKLCGIVFAPGDGFFDAELTPIARI